MALALKKAGFPQPFGSEKPDRWFYVSARFKMTSDNIKKLLREDGMPTEADDVVYIPTLEELIGVQYGMFLSLSMTGRDTWIAEANSGEGTIIDATGIDAEDACCRLYLKTKGAPAPDEIVYQNL